LQTYQALKKGADDAGISVEGLNRILGNIDRPRPLPPAVWPRHADRHRRPVRGRGASLQQIASGLGIAQQSADAFGRTAGARST
jgi:hypothetical protein